MRVLIAGAGGVIGSAVMPDLANQGHAIVRLVRRAPGAGEVRWDPDTGTIDAAGLDGFDGVVHVASLPQSRWTPAFIKRWRANHIGTNRLLTESLARCERKPRVLVCASAQGIYPPSGDQILAEDSSVGTDYLAELLRDGEQATARASDASIRVVHLRIPTVLSGTSLAAMSSNIRRLGSGRQWFSWVARDEIVWTDQMSQAVRGDEAGRSETEVGHHGKKIGIDAWSRAFRRGSCCIRARHSPLVLALGNARRGSATLYAWR